MPIKISKYYRTLVENEFGRCEHICKNGAQCTRAMCPKYKIYATKDITSDMFLCAMHNNERPKCAFGLCTVKAMINNEEHSCCFQGRMDPDGIIRCQYHRPPEYKNKQTKTRVATKKKGPSSSPPQTESPPGSSATSPPQVDSPPGSSGSSSLPTSESDSDKRDKIISQPKTL
jgi:hypothetical protein